ncbi:LysR substrate-binding domain-containing protein [Streptomyces showdoensis]|uniref:LysR substrate-binding domain-containing protein n=1 Tax=Streptomyces showdoensis TaxID=68268 RepID=UPI0013F4DAD8
MVVDVPLVAAVAPGEPLLDHTDGAGVPLAALRDRPLICLPHGTGVCAALERGCAQAGFRPRVTFEAAAPGTLARLASRGLGVAVLAGEDDGPAAGGELRSVRIVEPGMRARIALAWQAAGPSGPAARVLLDRLRTALPAASET